MSVSNRESPIAISVSIDHHESNWNEMPGWTEVAVSAWQQVHRQSLPGKGFSVSAPVA